MHSADGYALCLPRAALCRGLLEHAPALMAFCAPATNSYRRLVPGYEAPVLLKHSQRNRFGRRCGSRCTRPTPKSKRLEFGHQTRSLTPTWPFGHADGRTGRDRTGTGPGEPIDRNLYDPHADEIAGILTVPTSLDEALDALEADHGFLTHGQVFTDDLIATYVEFRREQSDKV